MNVQTAAAPLEWVGGIVPLAVAALATLALGAAWYAESVLGLVPCALCLLERWPYRAAIAFGLLAAALPRIPASIARALLVLTLLAGAGLGLTHVGVEQGWWPDPLPECMAPAAFHSGSIAERLAAMPTHPAKPCDEPTYLVPGLPISMAAMDMLLNLALAATIVISWPRARRFQGRRVV